MIKITRCIKTHNNVYSPEFTEEGWRHYALTLESEKTLMTFNYSTTARGDEIPEVGEVIEHLEDLASCVEAYPESAEPWAAEYGFTDHESLAVQTKYRWAQSIAKDFRHLQSGEISS